MERTLNDCQRTPFDQILEMVYANAGWVFFLNGLGGSGKTFLYNVNTLYKFFEFMSIVFLYKCLDCVIV